MGNIEGLMEGQKHSMVIGKMMGIHHQVAHRQLLAGIVLRAIQLSVFKTKKRLFGRWKLNNLWGVRLFG